MAFGHLHQRPSGARFLCISFANKDWLVQNWTTRVGQMTGLPLAFWQVEQPRTETGANPIPSPRGHEPWLATSWQSDFRIGDQTKTPNDKHQDHRTGAKALETSARTAWRRHSFRDDKKVDGKVDDQASAEATGHRAPAPRVPRPPRKLTTKPKFRI